MKRDAGILELLRLNGELLRRGEALKKSIENFGRFDGMGPSINMKEAIKAWNEFEKNNFVEIP